MKNLPEHAPIAYSGSKMDGSFLRMATDGEQLRATDRLAHLARHRLVAAEASNALTTLGVVFGEFVLAASLSIGEGVQETIDRESHRQDISRGSRSSRSGTPSTQSPSPEVKVEGTWPTREA